MTYCICFTSIFFSEVKKWSHVYPFTAGIVEVEGRQEPYSVLFFTFASVLASLNFFVIVSYALAWEEKLKSPVSIIGISLPKVAAKVSDFATSS